ncbi:hypothetical protein CU098_008419 [Rhizopus stolonifer]|uniref:Uncharacterized protein n=1 Tax=Rhizopus stolonifer TaxID=4846 RepID=A0A367JYB6_RHIST|nr:hypothetical protein CU098_008419 [Rhizopus stolonifer]
MNNNNRQDSTEDLTNAITDDDTQEYIVEEHEPETGTFRMPPLRMPTTEISVTQTFLDPNVPAEETETETETEAERRNRRIWEEHYAELREGMSERLERERRLQERRQFLRRIRGQTLNQRIRRSRRRPRPSVPNQPFSSHQEQELQELIERLIITNPRIRVRTDHTSRGRAESLISTWPSAEELPQEQPEEQTSRRRRLVASPSPPAQEPVVAPPQETGRRRRLVLSPSPPGEASETAPPRRRRRMLVATSSSSEEDEEMTERSPSPEEVDQPPTLNMQGYNEIFQNLETDEERINFIFKGQYRDRRYGLHQEPTTPLQGLFYAVDIDAVSILCHEIPIAEGTPLSLYILPDFRLVVKQNKGIYYEGRPLNKIPNMYMASFGHTNRFKVNIFFPNIGIDTCDVQNEAVDFFVDRILLPALREVSMPQSLHRIPSSAQAERSRASRRRGIYSFDPVYYYENENMDTLAACMRRQIQNVNATDNRYESYHAFDNFFFFVYTYGNKSEIEVHQEADRAFYQQQFTNAFSDLNYHTIDPRNVFLDIGVHIGREGSTGLWLLNNNNSPVLDLYFEQVNRSEKYLRLDRFAHITNIGGCSYRAHIPGGVGHHRLIRLQCYHTMKSPYYARDSSGYRHSAFDLTADQLYKNTELAINTMHQVQRILMENQWSTYPARIEFSLNMDNAFNLLINMDAEINRILNSREPLITFIDTQTVSLFIVNMIHSLLLYYQSVANQRGLINTEQSLTTLALISYYYSGVLSRPYDYSYYRRLIQLLSRLRSPVGSLFQFDQENFEFNLETRRWEITEMLDMDQLLRIFYKSALDIRRGTTA